MKRSSIINLIEKILSSYENCSLKGASIEILEHLEDQGMTPPAYFDGKNDYGLIVKEGWEPETRSKK